ncbi:MAG: hypothetical protein COA47_07730 [Robiginitomaculum sp.]|nr:MAG: hypothetical protein COA47_07730 [Robiginitomaculum sp.]
MKRSANSKPKVLIANGDKKGRSSLARDLASLGYGVRATDDLSTILGWAANAKSAIVLLDVDLFDAHRNGFDVMQEIRKVNPDCPIIAMGGENTVLSSLLSARFGAVDFFAKPYSFSQLASAIANALLEKETGNTQAKPRVEEPVSGKSASMHHVMRTITKAARSVHPVLIIGEPGTGKFRVAETIHKYGDDESAPLIRLQATTPDDQMKEWLSSSEARPTGTLVLQRLDRFEPARQLWICDWLDRQSSTDQQLRLIATALPTELQASEEAPIVGELADRLNVLQIFMPKLSKRKDDIGGLAETFLDEASAGQMRLSEESLQKLRAAHWPGNVRQLKNLMIRAATIYSGSILDSVQLDELRASQPGSFPPSAGLEGQMEALLQRASELQNIKTGDGLLYRQVIEAVERPLLQLVLEQLDGNQVKAAKVLGINRNTLRKKLSTLDPDQK